MRIKHFESTSLLSQAEVLWRQFIICASENRITEPQEDSDTHTHTNQHESEEGDGCLSGLVSPLKDELQQHDLTSSPDHISAVQQAPLARPRFKAQD